MTRSSKSVTLAAESAAGIMRCFQAVELEAERLAGEQNGNRIVRAVLDESGLRAVISDGKATIEIADGKVAVSVNNGSEE
jgi:hypothetical protein